ncbi:MAG: MFS transporter [Pirellulales bacterium]|nr:MFS transporter [Pirellulales bacterium]
MSETELNDQPPVDSEAPDSSDKHAGKGLLSPGFLGLLLTQFLGAANDNMFRWLVVPIGKDLLSDVYNDPIEASAIALSIGLAGFVLPYLLLAAPAGYLADRFSKRKVIVGCKIAEVVVMLLGIAAIASGSAVALFAVVAMMGAQSALFGPAKMGSIPELVRTDRISAANGVMGLVTVAAIVVGTIAGNFLFGLAWSPGDLVGDTLVDGVSSGGTWEPGAGLTSLTTAATALLGVALAGLAASLLIPKLQAADTSRTFPWNLAKQTLCDLKVLGSNLPLLRTALGIAFFWSLAALAQINVDAMIVGQFKLDQEAVGPYLAVLALSVGVGSVMAGIWSAGHVELGMVPLGALGIALSAMFLSTVDYSGGVLVFWLFMLGFSSGLFDVPLEAFLQHRSPPKARGSVLAASNFITFAGMLIISGVFYVMKGMLELSPSTIFFLAGVGTIPVFLYVLFLLPQATIRFFVWLMSHTAYRVRVYGRENLPKTGGALLVCNHISWLDAILLHMTSSRRIRMLAYAPYVESVWFRWITRIFGTIPINVGPKSIRRALDEANQALKDGELVCLFPEGSISETGHLHPFKPGVLRVLDGVDVPVIPVYLDELWGSIFSYSGGRAFWKWPRQWPYPVSIHFGPAVDHAGDVNRMRTAVQLLGQKALFRRKERTMILPRKFLRAARRARRRIKIADSSGMEMTGGSLLLRSLVLKRILSRDVLQHDDKYVGVLLPPSCGAVLVNAALALLNRVGVNLNYTVSADIMNDCIAQCGIRRVLTSRKVMDKLDMEIDAELIFVEDLREKATTGDKIVSAIQAHAVPVFLLERVLGLTKIGHDEVLTVIFTSGSTGNPKGVMLSQYNLASNVEAIDHVMQLTKKDVVMGVLPFFHSAGYTVTMWTALGLDPTLTYHFNPLDTKQVGKLAKRYGTTILIATPTFMRHYMRRCTTEEFSKLEVVFAGAEKLPKDLADAFEKKFGVRPLETFGATELSPLVATNIPASRTPNKNQSGLREGTCGHPVPGVMVKIIDPDSGEELGPDQPGILCVTGPNVMLGYLNKPEETAKVLKDGWYNTGDMALVDSDGFLKITGRLNRFSKIGGEMVPHLKIEETLQKLVSDDEDILVVAVTAVADPKKGERLVVLHLPMDKSPQDICKQLADDGLPGIWIPSPDSFVEVDEIPLLGTGKLDLKSLRDVAEAHFGNGADQS